MNKTIVSEKNQSLQKLTNWGKVLQFLYKYPYTDFTLQEILMSCDISKSTAYRTIMELEKQEAVVITHIANLWRAKLNLANPAVVQERIIHNFAAVYRSGIVDYIIRKWGAPRAIVLFGSVRKGDDAPESDIDIAIEISEEKDIDIQNINQFNDESARVLQAFEKAMERKFKLLFFHRKKVDLNVFNSIANGIVLYGFLEVKP